MGKRGDEAKFDPTPLQGGHTRHRSPSQKRLRMPSPLSTPSAMPMSIQPIVLVGGLSRRFGRDKLREPVGRAGEEWLVDRPIAALRALFGPRVALVGACDRDVATRADLVFEDHYPGCGPAGGILSALEQCTGDVFVLAGDLPHISAVVVQHILDEAQSRPSVWAVLADADGLQPCIGLYRQTLRRRLTERLAAGVASLHDLTPTEHLHRVVTERRAAANVNTLNDWRAADLPVAAE